MKAKGNIKAIGQQGKEKEGNFGGLYQPKLNMYEISLENLLFCEKKEGRKGRGKKRKEGKRRKRDSWVYAVQLVECLHNMHEALNLIPASHRWHMMAQSSSPLGGRDRRIRR